MRVEWTHTGHIASQLQSGGILQTERSANMTDLLMLPAQQQAAQARPKLTAAQKALLERKVLSLNSLLHGAYYNGLLDDTTTIGRWHAHRGRFLFWEQNMGEANMKAAPHVADLGTGARFAPVSRQEVEGGAHVSDFAFETTR